jgi:hypothetical protein
VHKTKHLEITICPSVKNQQHIHPEFTICVNHHWHAGIRVRIKNQEKLHVLHKQISKKIRKVRASDKTPRNHHMSSCEEPATHSSIIHHLYKLSLERIN